MKSISIYKVYKLLDNNEILNFTVKMEYLENINNDMQIIKNSLVNDLNLFKSFIRLGVVATVQTKTNRFYII
jgi:hypothetical protein